MKKLICQILCMVTLTVSLQAQKLSIKETEALEKEADKDKFKGREYLMEFILKRDTNLFNLGNSILIGSNNKYKRILKDGTADEYIASAMGSIIEAKASLVRSDLLLYGSYFRNHLMNESEDKRTKKIKFNDVEYLVSSESKKDYNSLKDSNKQESKIK